MKNSIYTYKTVVEDSKYLFPSKELPTDDIEEIHEEDVIVKVIDELQGRGAGLYILKIQPGVGKSLGTAKYIEESIEEGKTFVIFSKRQPLLYQIQQDLIEQGIEPENINRLQGFQRAFPDYPARDEEGNLVEKDPSEMTEIERQIKQDYENGASPHWIIGKYSQKLQLDSNPWKEQFEDYKGKVVLAPLDYLTKDMKQIDKIISSAEACFIDEVVQKPYTLELNTKPAEAERFLNYMTSKQQELYEEVRDEYIEDIETPVTSISELSSILYGDNNAFQQAKEIYRELAYHSKPIRHPEAAVNEIVDLHKEIEELSFDITPVTGSTEVSKQEIMIASDFLNQLRYKLYLEEDPSIYNEFLDMDTDLTELNKFKKYAEYGKVEISERLEVHREEEIKLNQKETVVDTDRYEAGIYEKNNEVRAFLKIKDDSLLEEKIFDGRVITSQFQNQGYIKKHKHAYQKILEYSAHIPVLLLDATCQPVQITSNMIQYAYNRRVELERDEKQSWRDLEKDLNSLDKIIIKELNLIEPYLPVRDAEALENKKKLMLDFQADWGNSIPDWNSLMVESRCTNKNSTLVRLKSRYAQEPGSFSRTYSSFINTLEAKLKSGEVPDELEALGKEGYGLISYKGEIIDQIRNKSDNFTEEDTTYFYGLRGTNHLKEQDALQIGTSYINPKQFKKQLKRWLEMEISFETHRVDGWHVYSDEVVQAFHKVQSMDEQYQAIHRARPLIYDVEVPVMGRIPPAIREEVTVETPKNNSLKEYAVSQRLETILEEYGESYIVNEGLEDGIRPEDLDLEIDSVGKLVMDKLSRLDEKLTYRHGELRRDRRYSDKNYYSKVENFLRDNKQSLEGLGLTEFKQTVKKGVEDASEEKIDEILEEMIDNGIIKKYKVKDFPPAYQVSLRLKSQD